MGPPDRAQDRRGQFKEQLEREQAEMAAAIKAERTLRANEDRFRKELEAFSYSVSHDLRAPLRATSGFSRILLEDHATELTPQGQKYLEIVRDNARQMGRLIEDLLNFSHLSSQGVVRDEVDPARIVREVLDDLAIERGERSVEVVVGDLLPRRADAILVKQLFVNLVSNAFKFTRQRAVARIEIGCSQTDGEVVYFVKDDGAGFDMRYADKLFGVFQRLHRAEDFEGTGVGPATVQRIAQRHGGRVWADDAAGLWVFDAQSGLLKALHLVGGRAIGVLGIGFADPRQATPGAAWMLASPGTSLTGAGPATRCGRASNASAHSGSTPRMQWCSPTRSDHPTRQPGVLCAVWRRQ